MALDKKKTARIAVPIFIALAIVGIWAFKNADTGKKEEPAASASDIALTEEEKTDFALDTKLDLTKLKSYGLPIIIDFGATWCGPCREFKPVLDAMHDEMLGRAIIKYVDVDEYPDIAANFPVSVIPTQVFIGSDSTPYKPGESIDVKFSSYSDKESGEPAFTVHEGGLTEEQLRTIITDMGGTE